jgi:hypothetical protein
MANKTNAGRNAGQQARSTVNKGVRTAYNGGETVFTALKGFVTGFIGGMPEPQAPRKFKAVQPKAKPKATKVRSTNTKTAQQA